MATQTSAPPVDEAVDLLAPRRERHRAVENRHPPGLQAVHLACQREHRLAAEGDDHGARCQRAQHPLTDPLERQLALEDADLGLRKRVLDEGQRVERAEHANVPVLAGEQEARPGRAALLVVRPLHLVQHEHVAARRAPSRPSSR